jgi:ABC-type multidrug transport system permease subunit
MAGKEKLIDIKKIKAIINKNFIVLTRDKVRLLPLILFPVFMILIFGYTTGNIPKHISTALVLYDHSVQSQNFKETLSQSDVFAIKYVVGSEGEGKNLLDRGKVQVLIEIPPNFGNDIDAGRAATVTIVVDESDTSVSGTAVQTLERIVNDASGMLAEKKLIGLQSQVGFAVSTLQDYYSQQSLDYNVVNLQEASSALTEAKSELDLETASLLESEPPTALIAVPLGQNNTLTENNTFIFPVIGSSAIKSEIMLLKGLSNLINPALMGIDDAIAEAKKSSTRLEELSSYWTVKHDVLDPEKEIQEFTSYIPASLITPLAYSQKPAYGTGKRAIDFVIASIIALTIFQGAVMGMGRAIAGEKRDGSLTRVFLTPTSNATIILGTLLFYIIFEIFRSAFLLGVSIIFFKINIEGNLMAIALILILYAGISTGIGMIFSSIVKTEAQYFGMAMLVSMPTIFLAGVFFPLQSMPKILQVAALFLPVTYAADALRGIMTKGLPLALVSLPVLILFIFLVAIIGLVFVVFKRDIE